MRLEEAPHPNLRSSRRQIKGQRTSGSLTSPAIRAGYSGGGAHANLVPRRYKPLSKPIYSPPRLKLFRPDADADAATSDVYV